MIAQLKQMNTERMAQLAAANHLVAAALGAVDRHDSAPPVSMAAIKPFRDWLPWRGGPHTRGLLGPILPVRAAAENSLR
jgi:hypothetical protein